MSTILNQILVEPDKILYISKFLIYILLVLLCAFFASMETSLLKYTANKFKIKNNLLPYIFIWENEPENILSSIVIGTNLAAIGVGVIGESINIHIGVSIVTLLILGEILPKVVALLYPQVFINFGFKKLFLFSKLLSPLAKFFASVSIYFTKIFLDVEQESPFLTKQELKKIIAKEISDIDEKFIYSNIIELADKKVYDVMIPKENIVAVDANLSFDKIIEKLSGTKFSRVPVYKGNIDNIIGIIYTKDLIIAMQNREIFVLEDLLRKPFFVVNTTKVIDLLRRFKEGQHHMAIVVDEYGATVGLVTIEDIIEELVGEIYDEYDVKEQKIYFLDKDTIVTSGYENLKSISEKLNVKFKEEEVATIGGYVSTQLGYIPKIGEKFLLDDLEIEVLDATDKVIKKLKIKKLTF